MTGPEVRHDEAAHRFVAVVEGREAVLDYAVVDAKTVDFQHTYTPVELRGRGIAAAVVGRALAWARAEGKTVIPSCWYVRDYLAKERE
ncbi:MAG: GNAT family N-acetyltransferase [bacterium]